MTALLVACGESGPADGITEHEVDGVVYVDHPGIHVADTTSWRFEAEELFRIGEEDGTGPDVFGSVTGVLSRDDGTVLVADGIANELRHFDQGGRLLARVGRSGEGPGELAGVQGLLALPGDSVLAVDRGRLSLFAPDLEFVRTVDPRPEETVGGEPASLRVVSTFADGDLLMSEFLNVCGSARWDGFCEDSVAFVRTDMDGRIEARFGRFV